MTTSKLAVAIAALVFSVVIGASNVMAEVSVVPERIMGRADAPVTVEEYLDLQGLPGAAPLPPVRHHRARLGRVFAILAENAAEAMDRGGTLTVTGEPVTLDAQTPLPLPPGDYVHLAFRDAGRGIPEALLPSIFEPYVSTKPRGSARGTGLGLAVGHAILNQHRGALTAESAPGAGATFHIYLPV